MGFLSACQYFLHVYQKLLHLRKTFVRVRLTNGRNRPGTAMGVAAGRSPSDLPLVQNDNLPPPVTKRFSRATGTLRDLDTAGIPSKVNDHQRAPVEARQQWRPCREAGRRWPTATAEVVTPGETGNLDKKLLPLPVITRLRPPTRQGRKTQRHRTMQPAQFQVAPLVGDHAQGGTREQTNVTLLRQGAF